MSHITIDLETTVYNKEGVKKKCGSASPHYPTNDIVMAGWTHGDGSISTVDYRDEGANDDFLLAVSTADIIVGQNIGFDYMYLLNKTPYAVPDTPPLLWDTMIVHYLITGQMDKYPSLDHICEYYDMTVKNDKIKEYWKSGMNTGLIMNETIMTDLSPFIIEGSIAISSGTVTKPDDFIYGLARRLSVSSVEYLVNKIEHGQIFYVNNDTIDPPSITDGCYYIVEYEDRYNVLPTAATGNLLLDYVAHPTDIKYGFTYDAQNRQVYNAGLSVQPKWSIPTCIEITKRTLSSFGVSYKDKDFQNFGSKNIVTGDS